METFFNVLLRFTVSTANHIDSVQSSMLSE